MRVSGRKPGVPAPTSPVGTGTPGHSSSEFQSFVHCEPWSRLARSFRWPTRVRADRGILAGARSTVPRRSSIVCLVVDAASTRVVVPGRRRNAAWGARLAHRQKQRVDLRAAARYRAGRDPSRGATDRGTPAVAATMTSSSVLPEPHVDSASRHVADVRVHPHPFAPDHDRVQR